MRERTRERTRDRARTMEEELSAVNTPHTSESLSAAAVLFAGVGLFLVCALTQPRRNWTDVWSCLPHSPKQVAAKFERLWSPRSGVGPRASADPADDPKGESPVYLIAGAITTGWTLATAVWFLYLAGDDELVVMRSERFARAASYVGVAYVMCALWFVAFRMGTAPFLWLASLLLLIAHALCFAAEVHMDAFTYPGKGLWFFAGFAYSLTNGWVLYGFSLTYGMAIAADTSAADGTRRPDEEETFYPIVPVIVSVYAAVVAIALPSPGLPFWFLVVLSCWAPWAPCLVCANASAAVGVLGASVRVFQARGLF